MWQPAAKQTHNTLQAEAQQQMLMYTHTQKKADQSPQQAIALPWRKEHNLTALLFALEEGA